MGEFLMIISDNGSFPHSLCLAPDFRRANWCHQPRQLDLPGSWKPLEATEFEGLAKGVEALQFLQRAQQIGKARAFRRGGR